MCSPRLPRQRGFSANGRPHIGDAGVLQIRDGRHPVLDQALTEERFVPNDAELASVVSLNQSAQWSSPNPAQQGRRGLLQAMRLATGLKGDPSP